MKTHLSQSAAGNHPRRAVVIVMVIVVLIVLSGLLIAVVQRAVADRRQIRREADMEQAISLADGGIALYRVRSQNSESYTGEAIEIPAGVIDQTKSAVVRIIVSDQTVAVVARYPENSPYPCQVTRKVRLNP